MESVLCRRVSCVKLLPADCHVKVVRCEHLTDAHFLNRSWLAVQIPYGGWFPLALAAGFFFLACLWFWGMTMLLNYLNSMASQQAVSPDKSLTGTDECGDLTVLQPSGDACVQLLIQNMLCLYGYIDNLSLCPWVCLSVCLPA